MVRTNEFGQPIGREVAWTVPEPLTPLTARGRTVAVTPLTLDHAAGLWEALGPDRAQWTYMPSHPPDDVEGMRGIVESYLASPGWIPHAITDLAGRPLGMAGYLRVQPDLGSAEIGYISFGDRLRRSVAATEAMTAFASHVFDSGYRRYEWKCDALNAASRAAALRLGFRFEGVWRNALVSKGRNRDTVWFAMTDDDWRRLRPVHEAWLETATDDAQAFRLSEATAALWEENP